MAIGVNSTTSATTTESQASWTVAHTPAGTDRLLLVFVSLMRSSAGAIAVSSCTFGGLALTEANTRGWVDSNRSRSYRESIYYMIAPAAGAANVVVTSSVNALAASIVVVSLTGVIQNSPIGGTYSADISSAAVSVTATAQVAGSWMMAAAMTRGGNRTFTPGAGVVELLELASGSDATDDVASVAGYKAVPAAGATTVDWTGSSGGYGVIVAAEIKAVAAASQEISPAGKSVGVGFGGATVWNHRIVAAVEVGGDDGREINSGTVLLTLPYLLVNSANPIIGYIVRGLAMPATNVTVVESYSRLYARDTSYDSPALTVRGQGAPADFAETANNLSGRTKTSSGVPWVASNLGLGWHDSPDIRAVIQEIVGGAGWAGGNHDIAIFLIDNGTGGALDVESFEATGSNQPQLVIDWRFGGIAPEGKGVGVTVGSVTVGRGTVSVAPAGAAVTIGKGSPVVGRGVVSVAPAGKSVTAGKGSPTVGRGAVSVAPAGKSVTAGKGSPAVGRGAVTVSPVGKSVAVGKGTPALALRVAPAGKVVALAIGGATVGRGAVSVSPAGKGVAVVIGTPAVAVGAQSVAPAGKGVGVVVGAPAVGRGAVSVSPAGKSVGVASGAATVARVALQIAPAGKSVGVASGAATVMVEGPQEVAPGGLGVALGLGATAVGLRGIGLNAWTLLSDDELEEEWLFMHAGGGVNRLALVIVHAMRTTVAAFTATASYGGQEMALLASKVYPDSPRTRTYGVFIFGLVAPPTGEQVVVVATGVPVTAMVIGALTLANVSQSTAIGQTGGTNVVASTACAVTLPGPLAGAWLVGGATLRGGDLTFAPGAGGVEVYDAPTGENTTADITATGGYRPLTAAGAATWSAISNALDYGVAAAVEIRPALVAYPPGVAAAVALGAATVRNLADVRPAGLAVAAALGAPAVAAPGTLILPAGVAAALALGATALEVGGVIIAPAGVAAALALGAAALGQVVRPAGQVVDAALGAPAVAGSAAAIEPGGLAVAAGSGTARAWMHRIVAAVVEDGYETPAGVVVLNTTSLNVEGSQPLAAMATGPLGVPPVATIVSTRIDMQTITYDDPVLEAACELSASPAALVATTGNISGRTLTPARARWEARDVGLGAIQSLNLGPVVQQVVMLPGWASDSRLMFVLRDLAAGGWLRWYSADAGANFRPTVVIEWQFGVADLEVAPAGLGLAATAGEHLVAAGMVGIAPAGLAAGMVAGASAVGRGAVDVVAVGLAVAVAGGETAVDGGLLVVEAVGLAVAAAMGEALVGAAVRPAGLPVAAAAGAHLVARGAMSISPAGRVVVITASAPTVGRGALVIGPAGQVVAAAPGAPAVARGGLSIAPAGRPVAAAVGGAVMRYVARPAGLAMAMASGQARIVYVARPAGRVVVITAGAPAVGRGAVSVAPAGLGVAAAAGAHLVARGGRGIAPAGLAGAVGIGAPAVARRLEFVRPTGLAPAVVFGAVMVALARQPWRLTLAARGNELTVEERGHELTIGARGNELTVEER